MVRAQGGEDVLRVGLVRGRGESHQVREQDRDDLPLFAPCRRRGGQRGAARQAEAGVLGILGSAVRAADHVRGVYARLSRLDPLPTAVPQRQAAVPESAKRRAGGGDELPVVAVRAERELQDAVGRVVVGGAGGQDLGEARTATARRCRPRTRPCRRDPAAPSASIGLEALVLVVVGGQDQVRAGVVEQPPEGIGRGARPVLHARAPARVVPERERAGSARLVSRSSLSQAPCGDSAPQPPISSQFEFRPMIRHAPRSKACQPSAGVAGRRPEVVEVRGRAVGLVLVVARNRPGPVLVPAPRRVVAAGEVRGRPARVGEIARHEDGPVQLVQQRRRGLVPVGVARGDVAAAAMTDRHHSAVRGRSWRGIPTTMTGEAQSRHENRADYIG